MSNIFKNPFDNADFQAFEEAIGNASHEVCRKVDLQKFDPRAKGDPLTPSSHDFCGQFFTTEIEKIDYQIFRNQQAPDLVSFAGTRGWLHGYACAQEKAKPVIEKLQKTQCNLNKKTEEANNLKAELEELKSSDPEKRANQWRLGLFIVAAIAIANFISEWQFGWPF